MKLKKTAIKPMIRPLLLIALCAALMGTGQVRVSPEQMAGEDSVDYQKMTQVLFRYRSGMDYNGLHATYRAMNPLTPFAHADRYSLAPAFKSAGVAGNAQISASKILVVANGSLFADKRAQEKIDRYVADINRAYGCEVELVTATGGSAEDMKGLIQARYYREGLAGVVFIGRQPAAWFEIANDHPQWEGGYGYADWTCDLFFMDMDGVWEDADADGKYDSHTAGAGNINAEIFLGRIDASTMGSYGTEVDLLCRYLDKDHAYWTGNIALYQYALAYIDHDWRDQGTGYFDRLYGSGNYQSLVWGTPKDSQVEKSDYLDNRLTFPFFGFTQIWSHADHTLHYFYTGGSCYEREVHSRNPMSVGYNIDGCHVGDWVAGQGRFFICGGYVFNESPCSLAAVGTSKSGGMLAFYTFYKSLGENSSLGKAFIDWFNQRLTSGEERLTVLCWHYGMIIVGDPMIAFREVPGLGQSAESIKPPLNFVISKKTNRSLGLKEIVDYFSWQANPENEQRGCRGYRLYEATRDGLIPLLDFNQDVFRYVRRNGDDREHHYALAALDGSGRESALVFTTVK